LGTKQGRWAYKVGELGQLKCLLKLPIFSLQN
jgi:hypothetical protein